MASAYDFGFETLAGKPYPLKDLAGRPLLVVNTASKCGFTPQYAGLEAVWRRFKDSGLVVIGVPSNDFGKQEPGNADEIKSFCEINYGVDFPMMAKVPVSGDAAHPFFKWPTGSPAWPSPTHQKSWRRYRRCYDVPGPSVIPNRNFEIAIPITRRASNHKSYASKSFGCTQAMSITSSPAAISPRT